MFPLVLKAVWQHIVLSCVRTIPPVITVIWAILQGWKDIWARVENDWAKEVKKKMTTFEPSWSQDLCVEAQIYFASLKFLL